MRSNGTMLCAAVSVATGACLGGASAATLLAQNRVVESNASASDGVSGVTDPRMDQSIDPGIVTLEIYSYAEAIDAVGQCAVAQESSEISGDYINHFTRVEAAADAIAPSIASAEGRSFMIASFRVDEPEYWSLGFHFGVYNPQTAGAASIRFLLERDGTVLRSIEAIDEYNYLDAMTLTPGEYTFSVELLATVESDGTTNEAVGASCGARFTRYATHCPGDADGDRKVQFNDLNHVLGTFGFLGPPGEYPGDVNNDGATDFIDLNIVLSNFGTTCER